MTGGRSDIPIWLGLASVTSPFGCWLFPSPWAWPCALIASRRASGFPFTAVK